MKVIRTYDAPLYYYLWLEHIPVTNTRTYICILVSHLENTYNSQRSMDIGGKAMCFVGI